MIKPVCTVMVGLPACGKSTLVNRVIRDMGDHGDGVFVYSTDNLLEAWAADDGKTYNEVFNDLISLATNTMNRELDDVVRFKHSIVWDQTNLSAKKRAKIINRMRNAGYRIECECILFPEGDSQWEDWRHRMRSRPGKTIGDSIIESMMDSFVRPTVDEGFDVVRYYDMYGNLINS